MILISRFYPMTFKNLFNSYLQQALHTQLQVLDLGTLHIECKS